MVSVPRMRTSLEHRAANIVTPVAPVAWRTFGHERLAYPAELELVNRTAVAGT
jgi:hypothetical protein